MPPDPKYRKTNARNRKLAPVSIGLVSACLFGVAIPASKALLTGTHPQVLAGLLYLGAALGVTPAVVRPGGYIFFRHLDRKDGLLLAAAIGLGGILGPLLLLLGLQIAAAGSVSLWLNLELVATVLLGHFVFREHLAARGWAAAAGTLAASMLLAGGEGSAGLLSALLVGVACLFWGFDNHFTALISGISAGRITFWKGLVAGTVNLTVGLAITDAGIKWTMVLGALFVGALSYGLSVTLYITAARGLGATRSQMVFSTAPFFGLLLSVMLLGEPLTAAQIFAALIIAASLLMLFREEHAHVHRHLAVFHRHAHGHDDRHHHHAHDTAPGPENHDHAHRHDAKEHNHQHWPDIHHRHDHGEEDK